MNRTMIIIIAITCFLLGAAISRLFFTPKQGTKKITATKDKIVRDTVLKYIPREPVVIEKVRTKLVRKTDTVIKAAPFIATVDTVIRRDTIHAEYEFPEHLFSLRYQRAPDSIRVRTVEIFREVEKERPWWEIPAYITGSVALGFLLGSAE